MPGDYDIEYASPWAGANYLPCVFFDITVTYLREASLSSAPSVETIGLVPYIEV
jgi:hypothetical protein